MSLILEALRRSEAERRRGEAPDVLAPVEVPRPAPATGLSTPLRRGLAAVAVALVLGGAWWQLAPSRGEAAPAAASTDAVALAEAPSEASIAEPAPPPAMSVPVATTAPAPATPSPAVAPPPQAKPLVGDDAVAATPADATLAAPAAVAASSAPPSRMGASSTAPTARAPAPIEPPAPVQSSEFISPEATVRLAELSSEERAQLPALKVSMHMWAPDAAHRFVIIDGTRLAEGDRVADATISAILADGVTLAWRGRQIRLPIH